MRTRGPASVRHRCTHILVLGGNTASARSTLVTPHCSPSCGLSCPQRGHGMRRMSVFICGYLHFNAASSSCPCVSVSILLFLPLLHCRNGLRQKRLDKLQRQNTGFREQHLQARSRRYLGSIRSEYGVKMHAPQDLFPTKLCLHALTDVSGWPIPQADASLSVPGRRQKVG